MGEKEWKREQLVVVGGCFDWGKKGCGYEDSVMEYGCACSLFGGEGMGRVG